MHSKDWRNEFDTHHLRLFDETAQFLADGQARTTKDLSLAWGQLTIQHQENLTQTVAAVFVAQARAFAKMEAEIIGTPSDNGAGADAGSQRTSDVRREP
ncbi:hypothetical protein ACI2IP_09585 [Microbacterium sp. NPDC090218]